MPGTKMPAPYVPDSEILSMAGAENDWGKALVALNGDTTAMLNGLRDYLWNIKGKTNIDGLIKAYFYDSGSVSSRAFRKRQCNSSTDAL